MKKLIKALAITTIVVASAGSIKATSFYNGNQVQFVPVTLTGVIYSEGTYGGTNYSKPSTNVVRRAANFFAHTPAVNTTNYSVSYANVEYTTYTTTVFKLSDYIAALDANMGWSIPTNSRLVFQTSPNWSHPLTAVWLVSGTNYYSLEQSNLVGNAGIDNGFSVTAGRQSRIGQSSGPTLCNQTTTSEYLATSFTNFGNAHFTLNTYTNDMSPNVQFQINGQYVLVQNAASANLSYTNGSSYTAVSAVLMGSVWTNTSPTINSDAYNEVGIFSGTLNASATTNRVGFGG